MAERFGTYFDRLLFRRTLARWRAAADHAGMVEAGALPHLRTQGRQLRRQIDRVLHAAEGRLALGGTVSPIRKPPLADWAWRPELWSGPVMPSGMVAVETGAAFGSEAKLFHDCGESELTLRQVRNTNGADLAPFAVRMDVFRFDGSFLSLALDLPEAGVRGLGAGHVVRLDVTLETERPIEIFARLNIRHGPNTEQIVRELPRGVAEAVVEFDLACAQVNGGRVEAGWLDLIFEEPEMNQIVIRDLTMTRRPRAAL